MKSTYFRRLSLTSLVPLGAAGLIVGAAGSSGCSGVESEPAPVDPGAAKPTQQAMGEFLLHVQPSKKKLTMHRLSQGALDLAAKHGPGLGPQAMIDASLSQDDVTGSNAGSTTNSTVELVTDQNTIEDTFGTAGTTTCPADGFCADVKLNSFWTKTLNFTYAQITSLVDSTGSTGDAGSFASSHSASNTDFANHTGLDNTLGLWVYQSSAIDASHGSFPTSGTANAPGAQGVMLPGVANGATKRWKFKNPDDADTYIMLKVWASTTYASYNRTTLSYKTNPAYIDACTVGTNEQIVTLRRSSDNTVQTQPHNASTSYVYGTLPFDFTFYGTKFTGGSARVNFSSGGNVSITPGAASGTQIPVLAASNNTVLPATQPRAGLFPWWDQTGWGTSGGMCAKLVYNTTSNVGPNRQLVIGWKKLAANGQGTSGPFVNFNVTFNESTEEIWFNYGLVSGLGTSTWTATTGAQDSAGNAATGSTTATPFLTVFPGTSTTAKRFVLQPVP